LDTNATYGSFSWLCAMRARERRERLVVTIILVAFARQTRDLADETAFGSRCR